MISNENRQHWRDLKEDFRNCFDGASDLFLTESSELAVNGRLVCRIADRSILKICGPDQL
jgi:hypothetical protein